MSYRFIILLVFIISTLLFAGCGGDNPSGPELQPGVISGKVSATDGRGGIDGVLLKVFAKDSVNQQTFSNEDGNFRFNRVDPGQYKVEATLPEGFKKSGSLQKTIQVDGAVSIGFKGEPITEQTKTILKGEKDTLFTGSGAFIAVDASNTSSDIEVTIEEMDEIDLAEEVETKPVRVWIRPPGTASSSLSAESHILNSSDGSSAASANVILGQKISDPSKYSNDSNFSIIGGTEEEPLRLYANTDAKTYIDQATNEKVGYNEYSFKPPPDVNVEFSLGLSLPWEDNCTGSDDFRELNPVPSDNSGKRALILIHGLQPFKGNCKDFEDFDPVKESFNSLIKKLRSNSEIDDFYKFYTYRYPTNASIIPASDGLWNFIQSKKLTHPVLLAHSMGGLVGRVLMEKEGDEKIAGLITLSTPHKGSPIANLAVGTKSVICTIFSGACLGRYLTGTSYLPITKGLRELKPDSRLIDSLKKAKGDPRKIFTIGGDLVDYRNIGQYGLKTTLYKVLYKKMKNNGEKNDGMVPLKSAIPDWSGLQTVLRGHDHSEMVTGNDFGNSKSNSVANQIIPILQELHTCEPPPKRVDANDFNLSGSIARLSGQKVQVTLNAITINGKVIKNLSRSNITIVENGCVRSTSKIKTKNVGVDIVFVQDMSGSMGNAISGVRSSVISFANSLKNQGINAQIGSIGYSGPGDIPSTPDPSPCEYLGPFQDITSPNKLKTHVTDKWYADGGCDKPENALEAIEYAHDNTSWRQGAARAYIDITDASHHTKDTNCNNLGPCTNQSLKSVTDLVKEKSIIHSVASAYERNRTVDGGLDPWKLATKTGGQQLVLPYNGYVNLTEIGIADVIGKAFKFSFQSGSPQKAHHTIRIRVEINGKVAELAPALVKYKKIDSSLEQLQN